MSVTPRVDAAEVRLVDTTMLHAPASGGVKRYLWAKRAWLEQHRPQVSHTVVLPGPANQKDGAGASLVRSPALPFARGYRVPLSVKTWSRRLTELKPNLIEAGDPYVPGFAALRAGQDLGVPVIGFCHSDLAAMTAMHLGRWAAGPARRAWASIYNRFDLTLTPSHYLAAALREAGVNNVRAAPLGVDVDVFAPEAADREGLRKRLGVAPEERLLVFAGRSAPEKRLNVLIAAVERLGAPYRLLLIGSGEEGAHSDRVLRLPFESDSRKLAGLLASCDALVHANPDETLGLVVLEAMACGTPAVGIAAGGVGETVDPSAGELAETCTPKALAEAVDRLFARDQHEVRAAARAHAVNNYGWDRAFANLTGIYRDLTGQTGFVAAGPGFAPA